MIHSRSLTGPYVPCHQAKKGLHVNLDFAEGPAGPDAFTIQTYTHVQSCGLHKHIHPYPSRWALLKEII